MNKAKTRDELPKFIIAVDGHSSCGKSTFAKRIANLLHYTYIDSGAMYRAVTLYCIQSGMFEQTEEPDKALVESSLDDMVIDFSYNPVTEKSETILNGQVVEKAIREMAVSQRVSYISAIPSVRRKMVEYQRKMGDGKGVVMDGRDIGTVVFPHADIKIFLTASLEVRAMRRFKELQEKGIDGDLESVKKNLATRDHIDSSRQDSPLMQAEDALLLDNSHMTVDQQMDWFRDVYETVLKKRIHED